MITEITERFSNHRVRAGRTATYPTHFLWLVVHGEHDLPWWRRLLRRLRG